jgi:hypothetical protein
MELLSGMESTIDRIWEPVLKPPRTLISQDLLGYNYVCTEDERVYKRKDITTRTFDNLKLTMTCYLRLQKSDNDNSEIFESLGNHHIHSSKL